MPLQIPNDNAPQFLALRNAIASALGEITEGRVYPNWVMQYKVGETANYLKKNGIISAWMIMTSAVQPEESRVGGNYLDARLKIKIWAFKSYDYSIDTGNSQDVFEKELWNAVKIIFLNRHKLAISGDFPSNVKFLPLKFSDIDAHGFDGSQVMLAKGELEVIWGEQIN